MLIPVISLTGLSAGRHTVVLGFTHCSGRLPVSACLLITRGLKVASCLPPLSSEGQRPETAGQGVCFLLLHPIPAQWGVVGWKGTVILILGENRVPLLDCARAPKSAWLGQLWGQGAAHRSVGWDLLPLGGLY